MKHFRVSSIGLTGLPSMDDFEMGDTEGRALAHYNKLTRVLPVSVIFAALLEREPGGEWVQVLPRPVA